MSKTANLANDKYNRYRARKRAQQLLEIRLWVPDIDTPAFEERLTRDIAAINASEEEAEVLEFVEAAMADTLRHID